MATERTTHILHGLAVALGLAACLVATGLAFTLVHATADESRRLLKRNIQLELTSIAMAASTAIDGDVHAELTRPEQAQTPAYWRALKPLAAIRARHPLVRYLYTARKVEDRVFFVLDPTAPGDADRDGIEDRSALMDLYGEAPDSMIKALSTGTLVVEDEATADRWGSFISAYAPLSTSTGELEGVVGVDVDYSSFNDMFRQIELQRWISMVVVILIGGIASVVWVRFRCRMLREAEDRAELQSREQDLVAEQARLQRELSHTSLHDSVTGLKNREAFLADLETALGECVGKRYVQVSVVFLDFDHWKVVNEALGPAASDAALVELAHEFSRMFHPYTVARLGGDELAALVVGPMAERDATERANTYLRWLSRPSSPGDERLCVSASVGIALAHANDTVDSIIRKVDAALYNAKESGRGQIGRFEPHMIERASHRFELEGDLREAIRAGQLSVALQPIIDLQSGKTKGAEALLRWNHPVRGFIPPDVFIGVAEETGLIVEMGKWTIEQVCQQLARFTQDPVLAPLYLTVNVSSRQAAESDFSDFIAQITAEYQVRSGRLIIEVTESSLMAGSSAAVERLTEVRRQGVPLALDDFGTGFSSLSMLVRLPIDILKIDKSFVQTLGRNRKTSSMTENIVRLGHSLGMEVVAEGIETDAQWEEMKRYGCRRGQGWRFAKALTPEAFEAYVREGSGAKAA